jgi:hypothetical protein
MSSLFEPIDPKLEAALTSKPRTSRAANTSIRTVTEWFKLQHQLSVSCDVPEHDENIPDDFTGERSRKRTTVAIRDLNVCRFCYIAGAGK